MDRLADDKQAISNDLNRSKHAYNMHDSNSSSNSSSNSNAYLTLDLLCVNTSNNNNNNSSNSSNNNNNEKMDDANQTMATAAATAKTATSVASNAKFTNSLRQDSINSDLSPLTESVSRSVQMGGGGGSGDDERHNNSSIDLNAADDEYSNDNQSNASSDERASSDNNSTDNISFVSEDDIVENIIVLPNNFLSEDDESTNSDDVVYAYRGGDMGDHLNGIGIGGDGGGVDDLNADDETDFLEMDFEPDPASEIEASGIHQQQRIEPMLPLPLPSLNCSHSAAPMAMAIQSDATAPDRNMERTGVHKNWLAPIDDVRHANGIYANDGGNFVHIHTAHINNNSNTNNNSNKIDVDGVNAAAPQATVAEAATAANPIEHESNKSLEIRKMMSNRVLAAAAAVAQRNDDRYSSSSSPYYDNTVSLSTQKYTGTIPKTNNNSKLQLLVRPTKTRSATDCNGVRGESHATASCSTPPPSHLVGGQLDLRLASKRWKITDQMVENSPSTSSYCDSFDGTDGGGGGSGRGVADCGHTKHASAVVRSMSFPNANDSSYQRMFAIRAVRCEPTGADNDVGQPASVTFDSTYCTIETIVKALDKVNLCPNVRTLQTVLCEGDETIMQMNIPEYLVYASKRYCNYKAIVTAIEQSCDDVDVKFYLADMGPMETVNIPFRMIASRLPTNGSLTNILTIKNRRFHQMNVLGKIVNMIRRFPDMQDSLIHNEFITIPQYYPSGVICVSKKEPSSN